MQLTPWKAWSSRVNQQSLVQDFSAGLSGALIVLPQGMAYALIAGLPAQFGLYCAIVPAIVAALLGSSWHMVSGPTAAISIVVFSALTPLATAGSLEYILLAITLALLVGLVQVALAVFRLGKLADRIPHSVIVGFTCGAAFLIAVSQLKHALGLQLPAGNGFFPVLTAVWSQLSTFNSSALIVAIATMLVAVFTKRFLKPLPHLVAGMIAGALTGAALGDKQLKLVGALPSALPSYTQPSFDFSQWQALGSAALVVALLALTEAIAIARALALRSGQTIDGNQETFAQGMSNIAGAFFSGYPSSGSFTRSGINLEAGAQTPLAAVFAALVLVGLLVLVAPLVAYLPLASMAGVLMLVAWGLVDIKAIHELWDERTSKAIFLLTFLSCLIFDVKLAVFAGIALAVVLSITVKKH